MNYIADCIRLVGYVIYHDPWPILEDDAMKKERNQTDSIWKHEFQVDIMTDHCSIQWITFLIGVINLLYIYSILSVLFFYFKQIKNY